MVIDDSRRCPFFSGRLRPPSRNGLIHQLSGRYPAFKAAYGTSPAAFVADARIERAIELLNSTDEPIAHIARAVGYRKPGAFAEAFRRRTGVPPSAYRRRSA